MNFLKNLLKALVAIFVSNKPPVSWQMNVVGVHPPQANVQLTFDGKTWPAGPGGEPERLINFNATTAKPGVPGVLTATLAGYVPTVINLPTIGPPTQFVHVGPLVESIPFLEPLYVQGKLFFTQSGKPWRWKLCSEFLALKKFVDGVDLTDLAKDIRSVKGNGMRVFCQWHNPPNGNDRFGPDYISPDQMARFADWAFGQGLRVEFTALTDCQDWGMDHQAQVNRVRDVVEVLRTKANVFVEICNEPMKNGCDTTRVVDDLDLRDKSNRPILMATGNYGIAELHQEGTYFALDYAVNHGSRDANWPAEVGKSGHFIYDGWKPGNHESGEPYPGWAGFQGQDVAVVQDEPIGADETSTPGRRDADPNNWADAGAAFGIMSTGGTFHSQAGLEALPWGPVQFECARRYFEAMDSFPADAFNGQYTHNETFTMPLEDAHDVTEVIGSLHGSVAYCVATQPQDSYHAVARNGWYLALVYGWRNNYTTLQR